MKKLTLSLALALTLALAGYVGMPTSVAFAEQGQAVDPGQGKAVDQGQGQAVDGTKPALATLPNPLKVSSISALFYNVIDFVISLSYVVIAFFLLLSGFKFVTAQGSEDKLNEAKRMFFNTIIGTLIIVGANTIVAVVRTIITSLQQ